MGLRAPTWPVEGEYRRALLLRTGAAWTLEVQRFDGTVARVPLSDAQVSALRLEVTARAAAIARSTGRPMVTVPLATAVGGDAPAPGGGPVAAPPATPSSSATGIGADTPIGRRAFVWRETTLGMALFGPLAWAAVDSRAFSPSAYLFTAAGAFLLATNAINRAPFGEAQTDIGTLAAFGGAAGSAALAWSLADASPRATAGAALVGGVALHTLGLGWGRGASAAEARGVAYGAGLSALVATGVLGAAGRFEQPTERDDKLVAGVLAAATLAGGPLGRAYVNGRAHRVTDGDVGAVALAGGVATVLGVGLAGGTTAPDPAKYGAATALGVLGLVAGDRLLAKPYDHDLADVGTLTVGAGAGAAIAVLPYWLAGRANERTALILAGVGGIAGLWGGEVVTRPRAGTARVGARAASPGRGSVRFDPAAAAFAALRMPGMFPLVRATF